MRPFYVTEPLDASVGYSPAHRDFTSIRPERRVAHYPYVEGIFLDLDERLLGLHGSDDPAPPHASTHLASHR